MYVQLGFREFHIHFVMGSLVYVVMAIYVEIACVSPSLQGIDILINSF